jgi:cholesterol transport system auxiliary component
MIQGAPLGKGSRRRGFAGAGLFLKRLEGWARRTVPLVALALLVAGCSLFRGPPPETFDLAAPSSISASGGTAAQLLVPEPSALKTLDSERIVVASGPRLYYYPDAQWPDRIPRVFQARTIEAFENSRKVKAVGRPGEGLSIDYQVVTNIRSFEYREQSKTGGYAHVEVFVKVMDDRNGRVVATRTITGNAPVTANTATAVVAGLDAALAEVLVELVRWTLRIV